MTYICALVFNKTMVKCHVKSQQYYLLKTGGSIIQWNERRSLLVRILMVELARSDLSSRLSICAPIFFFLRSDQIWFDPAFGRYVLQFTVNFSSSYRRHTHPAESLKGDNRVSVFIHTEELIRVGCLLFIGVNLRASM